MRAAGLFAAVVLVLLTARAAGADEEIIRGAHQGRAYRLSIPATPAPRQPMVVALRGCTQTVEDFAAGTRLTRAAAQRGLRVLYPSQPALANPARCWNWFAVGAEPAGGEVGQLVALVRAVNLACAAPDLVIAVGVAAGGPYRCAEIAGGPARCMRGERLDAAESAARCTAARGGKRIARASLWHGDADRVVSPANLTALGTMLELMGVALERRLVLVER